MFSILVLFEPLPSSEKPTAQEIGRSNQTGNVAFRDNAFHPLSSPNHFFFQRSDKNNIFVEQNKTLKLGLRVKMFYFIP